MLRLLRRALIASTVLASVVLVSTPASASLVFAPLALMAFNAGLGVAVTNAILGIGVLGSIASTVGTIALSIGVSYVASLFNRPQQKKPSDGQVEVRQTVPPRVWHYGRVKVSGPLAFYESRGGSLYKVVLLSSRQIDAIETYYLDDREITLMEGDKVKTRPYWDDSPYKLYVTISPHLGTDDQAVDLLLHALAPTNTVAPAITGTTTEGSTLTVSDGTWQASPAPTYAYQWNRDGVAISGATSSTYVLEAADVGTMITATVTATNTAGSASATSSGVGPIT